jgi:uroporphyrinogen-III decarboxylase
MLLFERLHSLRGFENLMLDIYTEPARLEALADRVADFDVEIIRNISRRFPGEVDGLFFTEDWGDERSLLLSPEVWRTLFAPRYRRIFQACRDAGWDVWMHSCGRINDIIGDLIDLGVNVLNLQQPRTLGIEEIGRRFAGRICFQTSCDIQRTLPHGSDEEIRDEARRLVQCWGTDEGGFILADDRDNDEVMRVPLAKRRVMLEAFLDNDRWRS